jgi:hypothetical protein
VCDDCGADRPLIGDMKRQCQITLVDRYAQRPIAWVDRDVSVRVGGRVPAGGRHEAALTGRSDLGKNFQENREVSQ